MPPKRCPNRLLVLCASINDVTAWPFWKFLQMKKIKGVTDMAMLAFNSSGGSFEARIDGDRYTLKNYAKVKGYQPEMLENFLRTWHDPGRSYFVYGGHGMGDYIELEQRKTAIQAHELAQIFGKRQFEAIVFDACFMANLDCAYHLRHNTRYIGACEGYMWEPDTCLDNHVFNTHNASVLSRFKDPKHSLELIQKDYCGKAARGDFAVIDTTHVEKLRAYVQAAVMPRVYSRATFYNAAQQERLSALAEAAAQEVTRVFGNPGNELAVEGTRLQAYRAPSTSSASASAESIAMSQTGRITKRMRLQNAIQFEHAIYPSEAEDKQLLDLRSYLWDMSREEKARRQPVFRRRRFVEPPTASRAVNVDEHGRFPAPSSAEEEAPALTSSSAPSLARTPLTDEAVAALDPSRMSAHDALGLFDRVVVSHRGPQAASLYASQLGGLSLCVHDYSEMSRPVEPWVVQDRSLLREKSRRFLKRGSLAEVVMAAEMPSPRACVSPTSSTCSSAPVSDADVSTAPPSTEATPLASSSTAPPTPSKVLFDYPAPAAVDPSRAAPQPDAHKEWTSYLSQIRDMEKQQKQKQKHTGAAVASASGASSTGGVGSSEKRPITGTAALASSTSSDSGVDAPGQKRARQVTGRLFVSL